MPAAVWNPTIEQGATWRVTLTLADVDLTGYTARMQVRATVGSDEPLLELSTDTGGGITIDDEAGTVALYLSDEDTAAFGWRRGVYDLELESDGGEVTRVIQGHVTVSREVTREDAS